MSANPPKCWRCRDLSCTHVNLDEDFGLLHAKDDDFVVVEFFAVDVEGSAVLHAVVGAVEFPVGDQEGRGHPVVVDHALEARRGEHVDTDDVGVDELIKDDVVDVAEAIGEKLDHFVHVDHCRLGLDLEGQGVVQERG